MTTSYSFGIFISTIMNWLAGGGGGVVVAVSEEKLFLIPLGGSPIYSDATWE